VHDDDDRWTVEEEEVNPAMCTTLPGVGSVSIPEIKPEWFDSSF